MRRVWRTGMAAVLGGAALACLGSSAWASYQGSLDPGFGSGGVVVSRSVAGEPNWTTSLALQSDGRILVGGSASPSPDRTAAAPNGFVARLLANGMFDLSFGQGGHVAPGDLAGVDRVVQLANGQILVLGGRLVRLNSDGSRDMAFGAGGSAVLPPGFSPRWFAVASDGQVVLTGSAQQGGRSAAAVVRLSGAGQPDLSFGDHGLAVLPAERDANGSQVPSAMLQGVAFDAQGRMVVAGIGVIKPRTPGGFVAILARLLPDGSLDNSFAQQGQDVSQVVGGFSPKTLTLSGDRILVGSGSCGGGVTRYCSPFVSAFTANGQPQQLPPPGLFCSPPEAGNAPDCYQVLLSPLSDGGFLEVSNLGIQRVTGALTDQPGFGFDDTEFGTGAIPPLPPPEPGLVYPAGFAPTAALLLPTGEILIGSSQAGQGALVARIRGLSLPPPNAQVSIPTRQPRPGRRAVTVLARCGQPTSCRGRADLVALSAPSNRALTLGSAAFAIAAGRTQHVIIRFTGQARARLRHPPRTPALLIATTTDGTQATRRITLGRSGASRKPKRKLAHLLFSSVSLTTTTRGAGHDATLGPITFISTTTVAPGAASPTGIHSTIGITETGRRGSITGVAMTDQTGAAVPGTVTVSGSGHIIGGTGAYKNATGTFILSATGSAICCLAGYTGPLHETLSGYLRY